MYYMYNTYILTILIQTYWSTDLFLYFQFNTRWLLPLKRQPCPRTRKNVLARIPTRRTQDLTTPPPSRSPPRVGEVAPAKAPAGSPVPFLETRRAVSHHGPSEIWSLSRWVDFFHFLVWLHIYWIWTENCSKIDWTWKKITTKFSFASLNRLHYFDNVDIKLYF